MPGLTEEQLKAMGAVKTVPSKGKGLTLPELKAMGAVPAGVQAPQAQVPSYGSQVMSDLQSSGEGIMASLNKRGQEFKDIAQKTVGGEINPLQTGIRTVGSAVGTGFDLLGGGLMAAGKALLPQGAEESIKGAVAGALETTGAGKAIGWAAQKYDEWKSENPETAKDIGAAANIASLVPAGKGLEAVKSAAKSVGKGAAAIGKGAVAVGKGTIATAETAAKATSGAVGVAKNVATVVGEKGKAVGSFVASAPERIEVAAKAAKGEAAAMGAATSAEQAAARGGFTLKEAQLVGKASQAEKGVFRKMVDAAKQVLGGNTAKSPADIAGSVLQNRIAEAKKIRKAAWKMLGDSVKSLKGEVVAAKVRVLQSLQKVRGLEGLAIDRAGNLNFSNTTLSTLLNMTDRNQINALFKAIGGRDAFRLHQLRQEIFEILGGRKKAMVPLTATQEQAFEAMRKGLSDAIESISPRYRALNIEYAKIAEPLKKLRKFYKGLEYAAEDILDERAGLLMSRLTSKSPSAQNLRQAIAEIDAVLSGSGNASPISLQKLQEFENLLEREYLELVKDTGFAGQAALGIRKSGLMGAMDKVVDFVGGKLGNTQEYRRKILDDLLK